MSNPPRLSEELAKINWLNAHRAHIQMRYSDIDAMGHLNNAMYVQYLENSRIIMASDLKLNTQGMHIVIANLEIEYAKEIKLGQVVIVESKLERLGKSSYTVVSRIMADEVACALARVVVVAVDSSLKPIEMPLAAREILTGLKA